MKLWLLEGIESSGHFGGYDKSHGHVVRAETEEKARELASKAAGDEDWSRCGSSSLHHQNHRHNPWLHPSCTTCIPLLEEGPETVILTDFLAG